MKIDLNKKTLLALSAIPALFLCGCDFGGADAARKTADSAESAKISAAAKKYFPDSSELQSEWIRRQSDARAELSRFLPNISVADFAEIRDRAAAKFPDNYVERLAYTVEQCDYCAAAASAYSALSQSDAAFVRKLAEARYPDDYKGRCAYAAGWREALLELDYKLKQFPSEEFEPLRARAIAAAGGDSAKAVKLLEAQARAKREFDSFRPRGISVATLENLKGAAMSESADYVARLASIKRAVADAANPKRDSGAADSESASPLSRAERIFAKSLFTKRGVENEIHAAVLAKFKGRTVVLCTKEFMPEKFPVVFANAAGKVSCSRAFVSDELPLLMLVPDSVPQSLEALEIADDSEVRMGAELLAVAPDGGGYRALGVSVFSADEKYLNLTADTNPRVSHKIDVKHFGRDAKTFVSVSEISEVGDDAVAVDAKTGKLVSFSVRIYNPGVLSHHGKTGSIIGHENSPIPDFTTFVRQFDGSVNKTFVPFSSIRFVRMGALEKWKPLDIAKFARQKNEIRILTDENNDFMMFFKNNTFGEALRSRRLGTIAERYKKPFLHDRLSRESYERSYRNYMIEVSFALKRELQRYANPDAFYSIYRQELLYQLKLRRSMYEYLAEGVKDTNIVNILHTDLATRYDNCGVNTERVGGSIGGGY